MGLTIYEGDNLSTLQRLAAAGARFDLVEVDGPYGANLEEWDSLSEGEYIAHYAARLPWVSQMLQPWGVAFVFGYPEGCAEIKAWARHTQTFALLRWLTWFLNSTQHAGRRTQTILIFTAIKSPSLWSEFQQWLQQRRRSMGITVVNAHKLTGINTAQGRARGGFLWFESDTARIPTVADYDILKQVFDIPDKFDSVCGLASVVGLTDIDMITVPPEQAQKLNIDGLRSKPLALYDRLFRPIVPARERRHALILYGGSGNAAIAAGKLGYEVTVCESDPARCELIRQRWAVHIDGKDTLPVVQWGPLFRNYNEVDKTT